METLIKWHKCEDEMPKKNGNYLCLQRYEYSHPLISCISFVAGGKLFNTAHSEDYGFKTEYWAEIPAEFLLESEDM